MVTGSLGEMTDRPALPKELRRRVLVEAGHRCAIHTCRYAAGVDVHHIVPWEKCQEHTYDNLIALCPNCHRRADSGEIDRKSLRIYKARLSAGVIDTGEPAIGVGRPDGPGSGEEFWTISMVEETRSDIPPYEFQLEIPQFVEEDLLELNQLERGWALQRLQESRVSLVEEPDPVMMDLWNRGLRDSLAGSFEVLLYSSSLVSLRYSLSSYGVGAAHAIHPVRSVTAQRRPVTYLSLADIFRDESDYLERISRYTRNALLQSLPDEAASIAAETTPEPRNFAVFNVVGSGLLITFTEYRVASFAQGPQHVTVPWGELQDALNPRCAVLEHVASK